MLGEYEIMHEKVQLDSFLVWRRNEFMCFDHSWCGDKGKMGKTVVYEAAFQRITTKKNS